MGAPGEDDMDMDTAGVLAEMSRLHSDAEGYGFAWRTVRGEIGNDEPGIADDPLGDTFWAGYQPDSESLGRKADETERKLLDSAAVGETSAWLYRVADYTARIRFQR